MRFPDPSADNIGRPYWVVIVGAQTGPQQHIPPADGFVQVFHFTNLVTSASQATHAMSNKMLDGDALTALLPTTIEDFPPADSSHASAKPMSSFTAGIMRLKRALHRYASFLCVIP
jgi:hypothetical protein